MKDPCWWYVCIIHLFLEATSFPLSKKVFLVKEELAQIYPFAGDTFMWKPTFSSVQREYYLNVSFSCHLLSLSETIFLAKGCHLMVLAWNSNILIHIFLVLKLVLLFYKAKRYSRHAVLWIHLRLKCLKGAITPFSN